MSVADSAAFPPAPLDLHAETVRVEWIDYNGHMNMAYHVLIFDHATDAVFESLGLGADYRATSGCSVYVVESHIRYLAEVRAGETVRVLSRLLGFDAKRIHLHHAMMRSDAGETAATIEIMALHVDRDRGRVVPLPAAALAALGRLAAEHGRLAKPAEAGRGILLSPPRGG